MLPAAIAFISQKGGTGKTTTALTLAVAAYQSGKSVLVLDLDPQANMTSWHETRADKSPLVQPTHPAALKSLLSHAGEEKVDWVIIDTAAGTDTSAAAAVDVADLVLIACRPSRFDLEAIANSVRLCRVRDVIPRVILTQIDAQGSMQDEARAQLARLGIAVLPGGLGSRAAFRHSTLSGQAVTEYEPTGKAAKEAQALYAAVCHLVDKASRPQGDKPPSYLDIGEGVA
jgi:chromosome partitioning protein